MSRGKAAMTAIQPLVVVVSGGGPVGLTFSLHLTMMMGKQVKIIIYEGRWFVDAHGKTRWQGEEQGKTRRDQVVTLQDHVINQMPEYIQRGLFERINERVWPTSRNIPIREVEDRLFDLLQPFVQNGQVELVPENLHEQSECLIKGNFDVLVGTDGSNSFVRRYCNIQMISEGLEYACGVAYNIPTNIPSNEEPLHQALNCILTVSQTRYLVNSSTSRRGYLNIRLIKDEYDELSECLKEFQSRNHSIDLTDTERCPKTPVWTIIRQGLDFFQIQYKYVFRVIPIEINVRHASIVVRELRYEIQKPDQPNADSEEKVYRTALAFLAGDAAMNVHFWPGRGMNSGMKAAMALARNIVDACTQNNVIHIRTPLRFLDFLEYEAFMARLRAREQQGRSLRILTNPIDQVFEGSYSYAHANKCYVRYTKKLIEKLQEIRKRLESNAEWPHRARSVTDDELKSASRRITAEAVAQLSLANPWPTREMSGVEVLVEKTFPFDSNKFLPVPTTAHMKIERPATVIVRYRFIILWIIGEQKLENVDNLIENIKKSPNFTRTSSNVDNVFQLNVVKTIEEAQQWIRSNRESIRRSDIRFKVISQWKIKDNQTAVDVIRAVRAEIPRVPVLIFTNKHEDVKPALEYPNVMETDMEFEVKEFVGINQETQWNAGFRIETINNKKSSLTPASGAHGITNDRPPSTSSCPYPIVESPRNSNEPSFPPLPPNNFFSFPTPTVPLDNNSNSTVPLHNSGNPTVPKPNHVSSRPILIWLDSATNDQTTVAEIQRTHPTIEIVFQSTFADAQKYLRDHSRDIAPRKIVVVSRGYYADEKKSYVDVGKLVADSFLEIVPFAVYTRNRVGLLEKTPNPSNKYDIFDKPKDLINFINLHLKN